MEIKNRKNIDYCIGEHEKVNEMTSHNAHHSAVWVVEISLGELITLRLEENTQTSDEPEKEMSYGKHK